MEQYTVHDDSFFIRKEAARNNLKKIVKLSYVYIICMIIILALNTIANYINNSSILLSYMLPLILLIGINSIFIYIINSIKVSITPQSIKRVELGVYCYICVSFLGAALVTYLTLEFTSHTVFYTLIVFCSAAFFVVKPLLFSIPIFTSATIILISMYLTSNDSVNLFINSLYYISLGVLGYILNKVYNQFFISNVRIKGELLKENMYRKQISKDLKDANRKLRLQNLLDPLTNLQNRMSFNSYVEALKQQSNLSGVRLTAVMIDIDCFKKYNDNYGHAKGDEVIAHVGKVIYNVADKYGIFAARYGGEEFTLLIQNATKSRINIVCEELMKEVSKLRIPHEYSEVDSVITISIGAESTVARSPHQVMQIIEDADKQLYEVKRNGKNAFLLNVHF